MQKILSILIFNSVFFPILTVASEAATSTTDTAIYRDFCALAAQNDEVFKTFKQNPSYHGVLENVSTSQGMELIKILQDKYPNILENWSKFASSDQVGSPFLSYYPELGFLSPTTLRYAKILGEILVLFGDLTDKKIIEVGAGYGGQCKVIADLCQFRSYSIVDLPEPLALAQKYLSYFDVTNVHFIPANQAAEKSCDLFISNYAFSECYRDIQTEYLNIYILNSSAGYMLYNEYREGTEPKPYTSHELASILRSHGYNVTFYAEEPLTASGNVLLTWKK